jgi:hypothetical protein
MYCLAGKYLIRLFAGGAAIALMVIVSASPRVSSADGGEIAYIGNDHRSIHVVRADGSGDRQLVAAADLNALAWAPDGAVLAYTTSQNVVNPPPMRIYLLDIASGRSTQLNSNVPARGPIAFFPDGKRLATTSTFRAAPGEGFHCEPQFLSIEVATGRATPIGKAGCVGSLQVAPDGAALIVSSCSGAPACVVVNVDLPSGQGSFIAQASPDLPFATAGAVSPDNRTVAYIAHRGFGNDSPADVVLADRDGSNARVIWPGSFDNLGFDKLAFSPDGTQLAVARAEPGTLTTTNPAGQIWLIGADGSNPRQIASGYDPVWRPGASAAPVVAAPAVTAVTATAPPGTTRAQPATGPLTCRDAGEDSESGPFYIACDDGTGVVLDLTAQTVAMYDPNNPSGGITRGPWPRVAPQSATLIEWADPDLNRTCHLSLGNRISTLNCAVAASSSAVPQPPVAQPNAPSGSADDTGASLDGLTDQLRGDILAAIDRANAAWSQAAFNLDPSVLNGAVGGSELATDQAQVAKLGAAGRRQKSTQLSFTVTGVTVDSPGHATVTTRESWTEQVEEVATGRVVQAAKSATYSETYIVELQDNVWIVTRNDVQPS